MSALEIITNNPTILTVGAVIAVIGVAVKISKQVYDFYDEYVVHRYMKRIGRFEKEVDDNSVLSKYLIQQKENEIFRLTSGISTTNKKSKMLMSLYIDGGIERSRLKQIHHYLEPDDDKVSINFTVFDHGLVLYSLLSSLYIFFYVIVITLPLMFDKNIMHVLVGVTILIMGAISSRILSRERGNSDKPRCRLDKFTPSDRIPFTLGSLY